MSSTDRRADSDAPPRASTVRSIRASLKALQTPIRFLSGVGPKRAAQLKTIGLTTVEDLLYHLPFRYEDRREIKPIRDAVPGSRGSFAGTLIHLQKKYLPRRRMQLLSGQLADTTGLLTLVWFRAPGYLVDALALGREFLVHGKVERGRGGQLQMVHPDFEAIDPAIDRARQAILPIYLHPDGLPLRLLRKWIGQALTDYAPQLPCVLPPETIKRHGLLSVREAMLRLHQPDSESDSESLNNAASAAHRSVLFEELFYLQLGLGLKKRARRAGDGIILSGQGSSLVAAMNRLLPFPLTQAQRRIISEIHGDMASPQPMQRLVQGDVGSGKTLVAWYASLRAIENGYQAVWMAPTELLAEQHFKSTKRFGDALGLTSMLVTAAEKPRERKAALERIARGEVQFIVGTHALIQEEMRIPRMALGVIDEQHRFGVLQRLALQRSVSRGGGAAPRARQPHMLLMSATPIPRSLAMILYGDLDVSLLDEMPPGRKPVATRVFREQERKAVYHLVLDELRRGHQAFIVYPLVEASDQLHEVRDATQMAEKMRRTLFNDYGVVLVHGRMATAERDQAMRRFRDGEAGVLVATTVIEVGIDIPNATIIVVEHAERFGLSQLHQLRGRVGRGEAPAQCLLVNRAADNPLADRRLQTMAQETDGFRIAEADLALRGPGEFLGTRQSGMGDFRLVNLARDARLLIDARTEALACLDRDPELKSKALSAAKAVLLHRWGERLELGAVG